MEDRPKTTKNDYKFLKIAISLGYRNLGSTWPNPSVGCVIVKNNELCGFGVTSPGGRPHAEENALKFAGKKSKDAVLYVTLEPCAHYERFIPCMEKIVKASIKRVVIMDVKTQLTIFEHKKKWGGADSTDGVDALVKTFYQFAHSIDKTSGKLERVRFEKPRATRQHFRKTTRQAQSEMVAHSIVKPMEIMEMTVKEYGDIRAIIFVDVTSWVKDVEQVLRKRVDMYLDLLTKL